MKVMIDPAFPRHRKLRNLAGLLGVSKQEAAGLVMFLWCDVMEQAPSGQLAGWSIGDIEHSAGWTGEAGKFVEALKTCRLLDVEAETSEIHEWAEHQGDLIQKREQWRDRQRKLRESRSSHAVVTRDTSVSHASPILPSSVPFPSVPSPSSAAAAPEGVIATLSEALKRANGRSTGSNKPSEVDFFLVRAWNEGPGEHIEPGAGAEKIRAARARGADPQDIEQAFSRSQEISGRKIWHVLDGLTKGIDAKEISQRRDSSGPRKII